MAIAVLFNHERFAKSEGAGARSMLVMKAGGSSVNCCLKRL
jgi:hypothetical protein